MKSLLAQKMVEQFHRSMNHPIGDFNDPKMLSRERMGTRAKWICEEVIEAMEATSIASQADAMIDVIYFCLGTLVEMGVDASDIMEIVHCHNMRKVYAGKDGTSKQKKPDQWEGPERDIWRHLASNANKGQSCVYNESGEKIES